MLINRQHTLKLFGFFFFFLNMKNPNQTFYCWPSPCLGGEGADLWIISKMVQKVSALELFSRITDYGDRTSRNEACRRTCWDSRNERSQSSFQLTLTQLTLTVIDVHQLALTLWRLNAAGEDPLPTDSGGQLSEWAWYDTYFCGWSVHLLWEDGEDSV